MTSSSAANPHTQALANYVAGLTYDAIPEAVRTRIKLLILDALGCGIYGSTRHHVALLSNTLRNTDRTLSCSQWATPHRLSAPHAALVNGTMVQGFELDDTHHRGTLHGGSVILPAVVALSELRDVSGRDFLTAVVAGYEVGSRVGMCMGQEHLAQGWHAPATLGTFAAAAAAASCLRLPADQAVHALGIAGTQACGLMAAQYGAMVKSMHAGRAAQSGLYAACLAEAGFTGIMNVFESEYGGFCTTFSRSQDRFRLGELSSELESRYETLQVTLKFYSCAASIHNTLDAIRLVHTRRPFTADEVDAVVVHGSKSTVDHVGFKYSPDGLTAAQMNLSYCTATMLLEGDVFVDQFSESARTDARRVALAAKVTMREDPAITAKGAPARHLSRVHVRLTDGSEYEETVGAGHGSGFASEAEVVGKFSKLARCVYPQNMCDDIVNRVLALEKVQNAKSLTALLALK